MKKIYWGKNAKEGPWDFVVIGSGIGGMATASLLAKLGKRVLILEQHYQPGGFTHTFSRKGYTWDVGVHTIGQVTNNYLEGRILKSLCNNAIEWKSMGSVCERFIYSDRIIEIPRTRCAQIKTLKKTFPDDAAAIDHYFLLVDKALNNMELYYFSRCLPQQLSFMDKILGRNAWKWLGRTTQDVMLPLFKNKNLFDILTARWVYYGAPPEISSFAIQAVVDRHFHDGGYYPVGGGKKLAEAFLKSVYEKGGWTRICAHVTKLDIAQNRVVGIELKNGEYISASRVVAAIPIQSLNNILPQPLPQWSAQIQKFKSTPAHLCLYLGFEGNISETGATSANAWIFSGYEAKLATWNPFETNTPGVLYCSFPSLKDPHLNQEKHTAEIITFVPWNIFEKWQDTKWKRRGQDYDSFKQQLTEKILQRFLEFFPKLQPMIKHIELSTPLSTNHFMATTNGSIYGLAPTPEKYHCRWTRPKTPITGLYLSGSDMASPGIIGAMMGGVLSAISCCPLSGSAFLLKHLFSRQK